MAWAYINHKNDDTGGVYKYKRSDWNTATSSNNQPSASDVGINPQSNILFRIRKRKENYTGGLREGNIERYIVSTTFKYHWSSSDPREVIVKYYNFIGSDNYWTEEKASNEVTNETDINQIIGNLGNMTKIETRETFVSGFSNLVGNLTSDFTFKTDNLPKGYCSATTTSGSYASENLFNPILCTTSSN